MWPMRYLKCLGPLLGWRTTLLLSDCAFLLRALASKQQISIPLYLQISYIHNRTLMEVLLFYRLSFPISLSSLFRVCFFLPTYFLWCPSSILSFFPFLRIPSASAPFWHFFSKLFFFPAHHLTWDVPCPFSPPPLSKCHPNPITSFPHFSITLSFSLSPFIRKTSEKQRRAAALG